MEEHPTLSEYINSQEELLQEAAEALPHQFSKCTFNLGHIRQAVYLCLTCPEARGLCSACSVACHTDHEQIELFPKRNFRCDCPTSAISHPCSLYSTLEPENESNTYGPNFKAQFCRCGRPYDAKTERETMIQCLVCEDWFHESCCNLRERPPSRAPSEDPSPAVDQTDQGSASEASSSGLPAPLICAEDYDSFVCGSCVFRIPILKSWAGTPGTMIVARESPSAPWGIVGKPSVADAENLVVAENLSPSTGTKRSCSPASEDEPPSKKSRSSDEGQASVPGDSAQVCLAPARSPIAQTLFEAENQNALIAADNTALGTGDIFLTENFRERWCHCPSCSLLLQPHPYLLTEEETYEPPEDPDSGLSLEELGLRALQRLPRDRAIDGIHAFNAMRDDLIKYLRPFAQEGKIVNDADITSFFENLKKNRKDTPDHV